MVRYINCKPVLKTFYSFKNCCLSWWAVSGFWLMLPESNDSKWKNEFKFLFLNLETV